MATLPVPGRVIPNDPVVERAVLAAVDEARLRLQQATDQLEANVVDHTGCDSLHKDRVGECRSDHQDEGQHEQRQPVRDGLIDRRGGGLRRAVRGATSERARLYRTKAGGAGGAGGILGGGRGA